MRVGIVVYVCRNNFSRFLDRVERCVIGLYEACSVDGSLGFRIMAILARFHDGGILLCITDML